MAAKKLLGKVRDVLRAGAFGGDEDLVDVSPADDGSVHVVVVSRKFDGLKWQEKRDMIWNDLMSRLDQSEWSQISLTIARSPEEIKAM